MAIDQGARDEIQMLVMTLPIIATTLEKVATSAATRDEKIIDTLSSVADTYGKAIIQLAERVKTLESNQARLLKLLEITL